MKTIKEKKKFDAVQMMREIRQDISIETQNFNFEQLKAYIKAKLEEHKVKLIGE